MRIIVHRVRQASVTIDDVRTASIECGLLCLVGFGAHDGATLPTQPLWQGMIDKLLNLRIFPEENAPDKMNCSVLDIQGGVLLVPQFTLYANCQKGRRPAFQDAAPPDIARELFARFVRDVDARLTHPVSSGTFGALMYVNLCNWGPVTITLDSDTLFAQRPS